MSTTNKKRLRSTKWKITAVTMWDRTGYCRASWTFIFLVSRNTSHASPEWYVCTWSAREETVVTSCHYLAHTPNSSKCIKAHTQFLTCLFYYREVHRLKKRCQSEFDSDRLDRVAASRVEGYCRWYPVVSASAIFCVDLEGKYRASVYPFLFPERRMNFIVHRLMNISWDRFRREVCNYDIWYKCKFTKKLNFCS